MEHGCSKNQLSRRPESEIGPMRSEACITLSRAKWGTGSSGQLPACCVPNQIMFVRLGSPAKMLFGCPLESLCSAARRKTARNSWPALLVGDAGTDSTTERRGAHFSGTDGNFRPGHPRTPPRVDKACREGSQRVLPLSSFFCSDCFSRPVRMLTLFPTRQRFAHCLPGPPVPDCLHDQPVTLASDVLSQFRSVPHRM